MYAFIGLDSEVHSTAFASAFPNPDLGLNLSTPSVGEFRVDNFVSCSPVGFVRPHWKGSHFRGSGHYRG